MMLRDDSERIIEEAENLADTASGDPFNAWALGVVVAVVLVLYGVWRIGTRSAHFMEGRPARIVVYEGSRAVMLGVSYLCAGLFLDFHFSWSWRKRYEGYAQIGKLVAIAGLAGGICCFVYNLLVLG